MHHSPMGSRPPSRPRQAPTHYTCCRVSQHFGSLLCGPSPSRTHSHALPSPSRRCPSLSHSRAPPSRTSGCALPPPTCTPFHTHYFAFLQHALPTTRTISPSSNMHSLPRALFHLPPTRTASLKHSITFLSRTPPSPRTAHKPSHAFPTSLHKHIPSSRAHFPLPFTSITFSSRHALLR